MSAIATIHKVNVHFIGDVHGSGWRVTRLLREAGWYGGSDTPAPPPGSLLVQLGDLIDRGKKVVHHRSAHDLHQPSLEARVASVAGQGAAKATVPAPRRLGAPPVSLLALARGHLPWPEAMVQHHRKLLGYACDSVETLRFFMRIQNHAEETGARLLCLVGNHEADLLRGRFRHARKQKIYLLALLGVPLEAIVAHDTEGLPPRELRALGIPELSWLLELPIMAAGQGILAVHGGPCERLHTAVDTLGLSNLEALDAVLEEAREAGFDHPLTEEGASVLSPGRPEDDMFRRPVLLHRLLELAGAETLVVGHSPFLHFPRGRWVDIDDPRVRERLEKPDFLGCHREVLKLDTDMKRGGPAWLVSRDADSSRWLALREDGYQMALEPGNHGPSRDRSTTAFPEFPQANGVPLDQGASVWPAEGVSADLLEQVYGALEDLRTAGEEPVAALVQARLPFLLRAGIADLAPIVRGLPPGPDGSSPGAIGWPPVIRPGRRNWRHASGVRGMRT